MRKTYSPEANTWNRKVGAQSFSKMSCAAVRSRSSWAEFCAVGTSKVIRHLVLDGPCIVSNPSHFASRITYVHLASGCKHLLVQLLSVSITRKMGVPGFAYPGAAHRKPRFRGTLGPGQTRQGLQVAATNGVFWVMRLDVLHPPRTCHGAQIMHLYRMKFF